MADKKSIALLLLARKHPEMGPLDSPDSDSEEPKSSEPDSDSDSNSDDSLDAAAQDVLDAIQSRDANQLAGALKDFFNLVDSDGEPESE